MRIPMPAFLVGAIIRFAKGRPYFDLVHATGARTWAAGGSCRASCCAGRQPRAPTPRT
jgi:hypothetical protein